MSTKREAPARRDSDRRNRRTGSPRSGGRATAEVSSRRTRARAGTTTAPTREPRVPRSGPQTSPVARPVDRPARPKNTSQAKARAKARKAKAPRVVRAKLMERLAARLAQIDLRPRTLMSKVPFVVLVIGSLAIGLALTLWLSTDAAERSYQLSDARDRTRMLQQQKEALERDVREAASAPALAEAARKQGMIPTRDTAHLVQAPDGNWVVVGTPKPADGVPPPPLNAKLPDEGPPVPPKPAVTPPEVAVRVTPGAPGDPVPPVRSGPQLLLRGPDGSTTLNGTQLQGQVPGQLPATPGQVPGVPGIPGAPVWLPDQLPGQVPGVAGVPGQVPAVPGQVPAVPGQLPAVPGQLPGVPGQVPGVLGQVPGVPGQVPGQVPSAPGQMTDVHGPVSALPPAVPQAPVPPPAYVPNPIRDQPPAPAAQAPAPQPPNAEQFGPVPPAPGLPR